MTPPLLQGSYTPLTKNCTLGLQKLLLNLSVCIEYAVFLEKGPTFTISAVIQLWINLHQLRSFHLKDTFSAQFEPPKKESWK